MRAGLEHIVVLLAVAAAAAAVAAGRAEANAGAPWQGGEHTGEPGGNGGGRIEGIAIAREELVIDLRPLAEEGGLARVAATYHLDNRAEARRLDLVFATGSPMTGFRLVLDGRPVQLTETPDVRLPESWRAPDGTPRFGGGELSYEPEDRARPVGFQLDVPPGGHELAISYGADAVQYHHGEPTVLRQLAYVLAPARTWAGFGGLDVTVHVPPGWRAAVTPALRREGDTLHATFAAIPADALAITVQAPAGGGYTLLKVATSALLVLILLGGGFVVARWTAARERRRELKPASLLAAIGRGIAWSAAVSAAGALAILGPEHLLPEGQADLRGDGQALAVLGVVLAAAAAFVIGTIASFVVARRVHAVPEPDR